MPSYSRKVSLSGKTAQELYDKVAADIDKFVDKIPMGKFEIERDPGRKEVKVKSSMATASLVCGEGFIEVNAKLGLMAAPFRGKLDEGIDKWLAKTFNKTS